MTLWSERMAAGPAPEMMAFTVSLDVDRRLFADDLRGSVAHVRGLGRGGILTPDEVDASCSRRSARSATSSPAGRSSSSPTDEDIHTAIERRITELAGATGAKIHTGRSRNDQVVTATRLYVRRAIVRSSPGCSTSRGAARPRAVEAGEPTCPGTPIFNVRNRCPSRTICSPTVGRSHATSTGSSTPMRESTSPRSVPARSGVRPCRSIPMASRRSSASPVGSTTRSTRSQTATSSPRRSST